MSKKTTLVVAGVLLAAGAVAAISAPGRRGGMEHGGPGMGGYEDGQHGPRGHGGWFGRPRSITSDEWDARTREQFARLDKNSDGVIDAAEIEASLTQRMSQRQGGGDRMAERMLARFDTNKDGKVAKDEFLADVRKRFAEFDLNNDGRITDDDLPPMMRGRNVLAGEGRGMAGRRGGGMGHEWLAGADANKDGVITLDELLAQAQKRFDQLDRNKDSAVDKADFDAMRKEMTDYRVKRFIHAYGADKDGKVTREAFTAKAKECFAMRDANRDGTISGDEMPGRGWRRGGQGGMMGPEGMGQRGPGMRPGMDGPNPDGPSGPRRGDAPGRN